MCKLDASIACFAFKTELLGSFDVHKITTYILFCFFIMWLVIKIKMEWVSLFLFF